MTVVKPVFVYGAALLLVWLAVTGWWPGWWPDTPRLSQADVNAVVVVKPKLAAAEVTRLVKQSMPDGVALEFYQHLPRSLVGVPLPESLTVDERGNLQINLAIRQLFDFYLMAIGEEPLENIVARVKHHLTQQLPEGALAQALEIFENYMQYRNRLDHILAPAQRADEVGGLAQVERLRQQMMDVRSEYFDPQVIEVFFAAQDQYDQFMLSMRQLNDTDMTELQKQALKATMLEQAPKWLQQQQLQADLFNQFAKERQQLLAQNGDEAQLQALRQQTFGVEAADRLAALAEKRKLWAQKLADYHQQLQPLLDSRALDQALLTHIDQLRSEHFSGNEMRRVAAIDSKKFAVTLP